MKQAWLVAMAVVAACGTKTETPGTSVPDGTYAPGDAADSAGGATATDAAADTGAVDSGETDAGQDAAEVWTTPFGLYMAKLAAQVCLGESSCCGPSSGCQVMAPIGDLGAVEDFDASVLTLDPANEATCSSALQAALAACDRDATIAAARACILGWREGVEIGAPCSAGPFSCSGGKGRCVLVAPPDGYTCLAAAGPGESCSTTKPCAVGQECLNGSLTRALQCRTPGSSCNLSDKCWIGAVCDNGACESDPTPANPGATCKGQTDCHGATQCVDGKCAKSICVSWKFGT